MTDQLSILRPYLRGWPIILAAMVAGFLVARKYLSYTTPVYESTTKIKLADLKEGVTGNNLFKDLDVFATSNKIAMEIEVLKSQVLIEQTLDGLDFDEELSRVGKVMTKELYTDRPFLPRLTIEDPNLYNREWNIRVLDSVNFTVQQPGGTEPAAGVFGDTLHLRSAALLLEKHTDLLASRPDLNLAGDYRLVRYSRDRLVEKVTGSLDVVSVDKDVAILRIIFKSNVPEKAARFTDALAQTYIDDYIDEKFKTAEVTADFLDDQIAKVYTELSRAENRILGYREENNIINIRQETETDLRKISQLKIQQTNVRMSLDAITELNDYVQLGKGRFLELAPNFEAFTDLLSTEMVKKIKELQSERTDLLLTYREDHELVSSVDEKISFYTDYFIESINNTRKNLDTKFAKLSRDIEEAESSFVGLPERERMLTILDREFQIQQQSYVFLNEKRIEAEIAKAAKHAFHRVIHRSAVPQRPVSPNRPIITIVSTLLGMIAALVFIFLVNASKGKVNDLDAVEQRTDIPVLYTVPHLRREPEARQYFKDTVFRLDMHGSLAPHTSLVFSGFGRNHGGAFHLQRLAEVFLREGRDFLVLTFGEADPYQLPARHILRVPEDDLSALTFSELRHWYRDLCARHDLVLVDNFTLAVHAKAELFLGLADENICVVDTRKTPLKRIAELNVIRDKQGLDNLHLAVNNAGYSPSLLREGIWMIKQIVNFLKRRS